MAFENLNKFFEKVKTVGLIERIFFWKNVSSLSYDAYEEFKSVDKEMESLNKQLQEANTNISSFKKDVNHYKENLTRFEKDLEKKDEKNNELTKTNTKLEKELSEVKESDSKNQDRIIALEKDVEKLKEKNDDLIGKNTDNEKSLAEFKKLEQKKQEEYEHKITELNSLKEQMDNDRIVLQEDRENEIAQKFEDMKKTWRKHEEKVEKGMKNICSRYNIEYLDKEKVPFKGKPDNTIKIADEFIIFDAKSPANDNIDNFPNYLKTQADGVKKYAKIKDVKKDIFLVVPYNTLLKIEQFFYAMGDYNVFIITEDSLEPIIKSLQKIEEYEFAEQLSPEDRDNICRIIGKFAHTTKRKIQIDTFFSNEFISILSKCDCLPDDVLKKTIEFEKSDKLNPPMEKRAKLISKAELKKETRKVKQMAEIEEIQTNVDSEQIENIPLYTEVKNETK
ncbi:hypothetical protein K9M79_01815 [Candidatus Woesearchaeota archaeon]|nr:hypothetical protein [Candidatus Woesearchaeota archaeon]